MEWIGWRWWRTLMSSSFFFSSSQILDPTTEMKDSGGIHNTTLKIGPPAQFMHAGRYICLVNNPEGHAHKEIIVRVLTDSQMQTMWPSAADAGNCYIYHKKSLQCGGNNSQLCTPACLPACSYIKYCHIKSWSLPPHGLCQFLPS